jgi:hypothetical protein
MPRVSAVSGRLSLVPLILCALAFMNGARAQSASFSDLYAGDPYYTAVMDLYAKGIVRGYPDGTFRPTGKITRAEMLALLYRGEDANEIQRRAELATRRFWDVDDAAWYAPFVYAALADGVIQGFPDNTFRPTANITADAALKMIVEARKVPKLLDIPGDRWYVAYARTLTQLGALPPWLLSPTEQMTRGTTAVTLYRLELSRDQWPIIAAQNGSAAHAAAQRSSSPSFRALSSSSRAVTVVAASRSSARSGIAPVPSGGGQDADELAALQYLQNVMQQLQQQLQGQTSSH